MGSEQRKNVTDHSGISQGTRSLCCYSMWGNPLGKIDLRVEKSLRGISIALLLEFLLTSTKISALHQLFTDNV